MRTLRASAAPYTAKVTAPPPEFHLAGGFSRDAIAFADGTTETDRIGGNALWAAMGARLAGATPHVHTVVGEGYPDSVLGRLRELGIDTSGVRRGATIPGVRVTFSYTADGSRRQPADPATVAALPVATRELFIDTTRDPEQNLRALVTVDDLPREASGTAWHLGLLPLARAGQLLERLRDTGAAYLQLDCPARSELARAGVDALAEVLPQAEVFLPSTSDTEVFAPGVPRDELLARFHALGAATVVLKCGDDGALLSERGGPVWHVPVFPEPAFADATGAGDVFGGAFGARLRATGDLLDAVCTGAAAASVSTRCRSPLDLAELDPAEVEERRAHIARRASEHKASRP